MTSETQKISFSGFIPYKVGQKSDIKEYFLREIQILNFMNISKIVNQLNYKTLNNNIIVVTYIYQKFY